MTMSEELGLATEFYKGEGKRLTGDLWVSTNGRVLYDGGTREIYAEAEYTKDGFELCWSDEAPWFANIGIDRTTGRIKLV